MDDAKRELVQAWLQRARDDLLPARKLSEEPDRAQFEPVLQQIETLYSSVLRSLPTTAHP